MTGSRRSHGFDPGHTLQLAGLVAAVVLAAIVNVLGARHFVRWDWTRDKRWTLSPATVETLQALDAPVEVWAIAAPGDPFEQSLHQLLTAYRAKSSRIDVHWIDPDRDTVQLVDLSRKFDLQAGKTEDGRVATDAVVVVASGDKHWFLTTSDLVEQADDVHVKPREERALTRAIRSVRGGPKAKLCFTVGHGEMTLDGSTDGERAAADSLAGLRELLEKGNYDTTTVDTAAPDAHEPFTGCTVAVVAGPTSAFGPDEANRLRTWLLEGGNLFAAVGPVEANSATGLDNAGLDATLAPFGIAVDEDLVHDTDSAVSVPETHGEGFFVTARPHPVTAGLTAGGTDAHPPRIALFYASSLRHVAAPDAAWSAELLTTTNGSFAKKSLVGAAHWNDVPPRETGDASGPFVVAMASERPRAGASPSRAVVVGSRFVLADDNWQQPRALHGAAFFVDSALSWLAARPSVVDVPDRAEIAGGMQVSEEGRDQVRRYVLMLMPAAAILLGLAVWAWRRSSENEPYTAVADGKPTEPS